MSNLNNGNDVSKDLCKRVFIVMLTYLTYLELVTIGVGSTVSIRLSHVLIMYCCMYLYVEQDGPVMFVWYILL